MSHNKNGAQIMRKRLFGLFFLSILCFSFIPTPLFGQNYVVSSKTGIIDWSNGIIEAVGGASLPERPDNTALARAMARKEAVATARKNLFELVCRVRIDSRTIIKDLMSQNRQILKHVSDFVNKSQVVDISYLSNGAVQAAVSMKLMGSFAELILPGSIKTIRPILQPAHLNHEKRVDYTGLILDCRGSKIGPAIVPRIQDEDGSEIYGPAYASREYAVQHGLSAYMKDLKAARSYPRVADNPIIIKGIGSAKSVPCDIVISNADAQRIRRAASNLSFLQKCRVLVVLD
jgi:hypothetical protein